MDAVILAAGRGERMRPLTLRRAKPSLPVGGKAMVRQVVEKVRQQLGGRIAVNLYYLPHTVVKVLQGEDLIFSLEKEILGTAGGVRRILEFLKPREAVLVHNGDSVLSGDLNDLLQDFFESRCDVCMAVKVNSAPDRYTPVDLKGGKLLLGQGRYMYLGVMVISERIFQQIPEKGDLIADFVVKEKLSVAFHRWRGNFVEITRPEDLLRENDKRSFKVEEGAVVEEDVLMEKALVLADAWVGKRAKLKNCIVVSGKVAEGKELENCIFIDGRVYKFS